MLKRVVPWALLGGALSFTVISVAVAGSTSASDHPTRGAPAAPAPSSCADLEDCGAMLDALPAGRPYTLQMLGGEEFLTLPIARDLAHAAGWTCVDGERSSQCLVPSGAVLTAGAQKVLQANHIVENRQEAVFLDAAEPYYVTFLVDGEDAWVRQWDCVPNGGQEQCLVPAEAFDQVVVTVPARSDPASATPSATSSVEAAADTTSAPASADDGPQVSWATWSGTAVSLLSFGWVVRSERQKRAPAPARAVNAGAARPHGPSPALPGPSQRLPGRRGHRR